MRKRNGDTLIEVTLAVGIFSLVAIGVVSVVNSSTSGAQTALETTLAREDIDTQSEALRFIQSSFANSINAKKNDNAAQLYQKLWDAVTDLATDGTEDYYYNPSTCDELYDRDTGEVNKNAFIINPRQLGTELPEEGDSSDLESIINDAISKIVVPYKNHKDLFTTSTTYPRIVFGAEGDNTDTDAMLDESFDANIYHAEGLYVLAVKGPSTYIFTEQGTIARSEKAYYDFYIRSCWYESGSSAPTTIGTVIRLYNPNVVKVYSKKDDSN